MAKAKKDETFSTEVNLKNCEEFLKNADDARLLAVKEMVEIVCDFYDNEVKANTGTYADDTEAAYKTAYAKFLVYLGAKNRVMDEIERRVHEYLC